MSLAKKNRLSIGKRLEEVKEKGKMVQSENFGVRVLRSKDSKDSRFGFVISTKISKLAVSRNRVRRALSESIRRLSSEIIEGYDFVFLVKKSIASKTTEEIVNEVREFFSQKRFKK